MVNMLKVLCVVVVMLITSVLVGASGSELNQYKFPKRPPLPQEDETRIQTVIVTTAPHKKDQIMKKLSLVSSINITHEYHNVFHGFSVRGTVREINKLKTLPGVEGVYPAKSYKVTIDKSVPYIGTEAIRRYLDADNNRLTGKGIKVGVIDTGVDYSHPDLRNNYKGGYDLVDQDNDPMETKAAEGMSTLHGTHVAGIIAANGKIQGVAPEAEIIAYRALGPGGMGTSEQVIAAIEKAIEDKVDIINLSLGNEVNGPDWPTSIALNKAVERGIIAVTSSGNSGPSIWSVGSPGTANKAISVGASTPPMNIPFITLSTDIEDRPIEITTMQGSAPWDFERNQHLIEGGLGLPDELSEEINGKVVLIERGKIPFSEKARNAVEKGASGVIIYNNEEGNFAGGLDTEFSIPVVSISKKDGQHLKSKLTTHPLIKTHFKKIEDSIADFSSRGPVTYTWDIKPDVVAPGVAIDSTVPKGYKSLQGTSMAAPHVAGAAALIKQAHPNWNPEQIKAALMNTAKLLANENGMYEPVIQGAGRIQVNLAVKADTLVYPSSFSLGMFHVEDARTQKQITLTIDNQSIQTKTYSFDMPKATRGIQWKLPTTFKIPPKEKKKITISIDMTPSVIKRGIYSDWLTLHNQGTPIRLPYLFVVEEPDYPRIMGFQFGPGEVIDTYEYEAYLPGGAEEFGIALYDPDTFRFIKFLDYKKNVNRGTLTVQLSEEEIGITGIYKALVFVKNKGREDTIEVDLAIEKRGAIFHGVKNGNKPNIMHE